MSLKIKLFKPTAMRRLTSSQLMLEYRIKDGRLLATKLHQDFQSILIQINVDYLYVLHHSSGDQFFSS